MKKSSTRTNEKMKEATKEKKLADKIGPVNRKENKMLTSIHQDPKKLQHLISRENSNPSL